MGIQCREILSSHYFYKGSREDILRHQSVVVNLSIYHTSLMLTHSGADSTALEVTESVTTQHPRTLMCVSYPSSPPAVFSTVEYRPESNRKNGYFLNVANRKSCCELVKLCSAFLGS